MSQSDLDRYSKQLELMNTICAEFEHQPEGEGEGEQASQNSSEKIMQLMQQVSHLSSLLGKAILVYCTCKTGD